jgi:hypothetical protein
MSVQVPVLTVGELRTRLLAASEGATANALQCVSTNHPADQDVALAAKNWSQAALAAAQAYKTLGSPTNRSVH